MERMAKFYRDDGRESQIVKMELERRNIPHREVWGDGLMDYVSVVDDGASRFMGVSSIWVYFIGRFPTP